MAFIKAQKIVRDDGGRILSGSASIVDVEYVPDGKYHSRQVQREKLGKVLWLSESGRVGVFASPTRGIVEYDAEKDSFTPVDKGDVRIEDAELFPEPQIHVVFGDAYLLLCHMESTGMMSLLRDVIPNDEDYQRTLAHQAHSILKDGSHIPCDLFVSKSFMSHLTTDIPLESLGSDTQYFVTMGDDRLKISYFRKYVGHMRRKNKKFGKACYLDTSPLPNDIDSPLSLLCSHGLTGTDVQMRLALLLDQDTGMPVWFDVIPGNLLDVNTLIPMLEDVESTLDISVDSMVLDAGYVSKELIGRFNRNTHDPHSEEGRRMIARMPNKNGYPYNELYEANHKLFPNAKYTFLRNGSRYFGIRREVTVFGYMEFAYVYVDFRNALWKFEKYVLDHKEEYEALSDKAKTRKTYEFGFFVLISNVEMSPQEALDWYFSRMDIEGFFKTSKEYLGLLPLSKWSDTTVRGKILSDIIATTIYLDMRAYANRAEASMTRAIGTTQSLMCTVRGDNVIVQSPNKQTKAVYEGMGIGIPSHLSLEGFKEQIVHLRRVVLLLA